MMPNESSGVEPRDETVAAPLPASCIITINGGSSSIKFAVFAPGEQAKRIFAGHLERIGSPGASFSVIGPDGRSLEQVSLGAAGHEHAAEELARWLQTRLREIRVVGVGHRVVHGGVNLTEHQIATGELVEELRRMQSVDLAHLPREISLIEVFQRRFPGTPQVACFDTAFHRDLPRVAKLLPIPRHITDAGVRRIGFHGLSYSYLMSELQRIAPQEAAGRVILAHLGAGASMAAVRGGRAIDTSMAFTPTAGLVMGTRPGDLDPGLLVYLMRVQNLTPEQMDDFLSRRCGLIGVSQTSGDMRDLLARRAGDIRAAEAVELFCYQARKWIGAFAAAMGGLDALVFSGGIGEHAPEVRAGICQELQFLGLRLDDSRNAGGEPVISSDASGVAVRVIPTDEEMVIARVVSHVLRLSMDLTTGPEHELIPEELP